MTKSEPLTFNQLREANVTRCEQRFHPLDDWTPQEWACALAGETGEFCNLIKKLRRGEAIPLKEIQKELADIVCYADLCAARLKIDLGEGVRDKFNEVSVRVGSPVRL
jgi:NTP pyrophosphatase (non-canonical NTP hydrolase)